MNNRYHYHLPAGLLIALFSLLLGCVWMVVIPPLAAPDEPAHLQAVMELRKTWHLPEIHYDFTVDPGGRVVGTPGDADTRAYASQFHFYPNLLIPYESMQPPLYYLVAAAASYLFPPDPVPVLYGSRLVSVICGAATVYVAWALVRVLAPNSPPAWATGTALFIALLPQYCFNMASVSNDALATLLTTTSFYVWLRGLKAPGYDPWMVKAGALLGLSILAKLTALALLPGLGVVVLARALMPPTPMQGGNSSPSVEPLSTFASRASGSTGGSGGSGIHNDKGDKGQGRSEIRAKARGAWKLRLARALAFAFTSGVAALATSGWWFIRNQFVYGDLSGSRNTLLYYRYHNGSYNPADLASVVALLTSTWKSFWGWFGWLFIEFPAEVYLVTLLLNLIALCLSIQVLRRRVSRKMPTYAYWMGAALGVTLLTLLVAFLQVNFTLASTSQGRYFFVGLAPIAMMFAASSHRMSSPKSTGVLTLSVTVTVIAMLMWLATLNLVGLFLVATRQGYPI